MVGPKWSSRTKSSDQKRTTKSHCSSQTKKKRISLSIFMYSYENTKWMRLCCAFAYQLRIDKSNGLTALCRIYFHLLFFDNLIICHFIHSNEKRIIFFVRWVKRRIENSIGSESRLRIKILNSYLSGNWPLTTQWTQCHQVTKSPSVKSNRKRQTETNHTQFVMTARLHAIRMSARLKKFSFWFFVLLKLRVKWSQNTNAYMHRQSHIHGTNNGGITNETYMNKLINERTIEMDKNE